MKEELVEKVNLLLEKYQNELKERGIKCMVSKKDINLPVENFFSRHNLLDGFFYKLTERREKKLYHNKRDKIRAVVLSFSPDNKKQTDSKDYALIVKTVTRIGKGFAPKTRTYNYEKLLKKAEKHIQKILKKSKKETAEKVCRSDFTDNLRYLLFEQYSYKKKVFGKNRDELQLGVIIVSFAILIVLLVIFAFL